MLKKPLDIIGDNKVFKGWTTEQIKLGFDKYVKENDRLPTVTEIDKISYLPSSRQIQRAFGGLEKLRGVLGYSLTHFGKGESRSKIALRVNKNGKEAEALVKLILQEKFGKFFVHEQKPTYSGYKNRLDFFVFTPSGDFAVDVFCPRDIKTLQDEVNLKQRTYFKYSGKLFLLAVNKDIRQEAIDKLVQNKKNKLRNNIWICTFNEFEHRIDAMDRYWVVGEK